MMMPVSTFAIVLLSLGGILCCELNNEACNPFHTQAMTALQKNPPDMKSYCQLTSQKIACFVKNTNYDCPADSPVLSSIETMKAGYYNVCKVTEAEIQACSLKTNQCSKHMQNASAFLSAVPVNVEGYCSQIKTSFLPCIDEQWKQCSSNVDRYDVVGTLLLGYNSLCGQGTDQKKLDCVFKLSSCSTMLKEMNKTKDDPSKSCGLIDTYLACVDSKMSQCDASVKKEDIVGQVKPCSSQPGGLCLGLYTCIKDLNNNTFKMNSDGSPDVSTFGEVCPIMGNMLSCFHAELPKCGIQVKTSFDFSDVAKLMTQTCKVFADSPKMLQCKQMAECMKAVKWPTKPDEIMKKYIAPDFWCSIVKTEAVCGLKTESSCGVNVKSRLTEQLASAEKTCPDAPSLAETGGSSSLHPIFGLLCGTTFLVQSFLWRK